MNLSARRGACPGLFDAMPTGDGLLARLPQAGPLTPVALAAIAGAASRHGNGILEATVRGSLQARGLRPATLRAFGEACLAAGIPDLAGPPVIASPLGATGAGALADLSGLVAELREAVAAFAGRIAPKVAIAVDDGGAPHLDGLSADIRLRALDGDRLLLGLAGDGRGARWHAPLRREAAVAAVVALLADIVALGRHARARDLPEAVHGPADAEPAAPRERQRAEFIGLHACRDDKVALGVGFPFGHADAAAVAMLARAAGEAGAGGIAPAPARTLVILGLDRSRAEALTGAAARLGFIIAADDPRRNVIACAGAPACSSALIPTRGAAAAIVEAARPLLAAGGTIHLSGCAKACASRAAATLTIVGTEGGAAFIRDGGPYELPFAIVPAGNVAGAVARLAVAEPV